MARIKAERDRRSIERHGGTVNQFVGDEIMALFGVPAGAPRRRPQRASRPRSSCTRAVGRLVADAVAGAEPSRV